ncbi:DUF721 domain-containing protein [Halopseudomonas nanhaiensis]|uniref:DUF721 domain-containing protein n=1 Tax=Halopseudomonas nanhaiensis TaxID=2830842 RepID=UPI001CBD6445|nr:DUF721 domain-containing protein [Halopseudomonas nanhaiensis]UAW99014.1 DUF721 domain-containing protein [Halopseudomonas nanhaiensis]
MAFYPLDARRPGDLIRTNSTLKGLYSKARELERLQALVDIVMEPAAREHCRVASLRDGVLRLIVTDSQWATRMRYQQKRLVRQLQAYTEFRTLTKLHCRVQPPLIQKTGPVRTMPRSKVASQSLFETAEQVTDSALKAALERLARHHAAD